MRIAILFIGISSFLLATVPFSFAQNNTALCGSVEGFDLPVPGIDIRRTDFAIYRARFGGLHTGIDVAFGQLGEPVMAAARGRVTYSDPEGWDTEKGVVVIQHTMPDGSLVNTLYGHMEELNGHTFPQMDQCVERGDIIGAIGSPSRGLPHLHYEIRTRYRHEGGPGYTDINPLELGWLHPVEFTWLARLWVLPAYRDHFTLYEAPTLPPVRLANGTYVVARSARLVGLTVDGQTLWEFDTLGSVTGLMALADGRVLAANSAHQVLVLANGSFSALWQAPQPFITPPILLDDSVVFMTRDYRLMAFAPEGLLLWETGSLGSRARRWVISGDRLALATQNNVLWVVDTSGAILYQNTFDVLTLPFAAPEGAFALLSGTTIYQLDRAFALRTAFDLGHEITSDGNVLRGTDGVTYVYAGEGRSLYAYDPAGALLWIAYMPGSHTSAPMLGIGQGALLYALTSDGQLLAYDTRDGHLVAQLALYNGGIEGSAAARWLDITPDDIVTFSSGYLSVITISGTDLIS